MEKGIRRIVPENKIHLPALCGRCANARRRWIGDLARRNRHSRVLRTDEGCIRLLWQLIGAWQTVPATMYSRKPSDTNFPALRSADSPPAPPVEIPETPWGKPEASDTKESIEDLRIVLYPLPAGRVDVVASRGAHGRCSIAEQKEEHATPGDHVETIQCNQKARGRYEPLAETLETDYERSRPG